MQADMPVAVVQGTLVNEQQERQPQAQTRPAPVPIEMLRPQADLPALSFAAGADGILVVKTEPAWPYIIFMMPFPFFCMGCCMSSTVWLTFDTNTSTMTTLLLECRE